MSTYKTAALPSQCFETSKTTPHSTTAIQTKLVYTSTPEKHTTTPDRHTTTKENIHSSSKASTTSKHTLPPASHKPPTATHTTASHNSLTTNSRKETSAHHSASTSKKEETSAHHSTSKGSHTSSCTENRTISLSEHHHSTVSGKFTGSSSESHTTSSHKSSTTETTFATSKSHSQSHTLSGQLSHPISSQHTISTTSTVLSYPAATSISGLLTASTVWTTETYTIAACQSLVDWCPYSLVSKVTQTRTVVQYTTTCSATESGFVSSPSPTKALITSPASLPVVDVTNSIQMTPVETPIVSIVNYASPPPPITYTITMSETTAYPVVNGTGSRSSSARTSSVYATITSTNGLAPVIYSVGGLNIPSPMSTSPPSLSAVASQASNGSGTTTSTPTSAPFMSVSDASGLYVSSVAVGMVCSSLMFVWVIL